MGYYYYIPYESKVWYAKCRDCEWEQEEYVGDIEHTPEICPECGGDTEAFQDWDNR